MEKNRCKMTMIEKKFKPAQRSVLSHLSPSACRREYLSHMSKKNDQKIQQFKIDL
jgi:hypothetical protein